MDILMKQGDIFLTRGKGLISWAIRFFTRSIGERRTKVNHVGVVVEEGTLETAVVVEARAKVKCHRLWKGYGPPAKDEVAVYRPKNLSDDQIATIVQEAKEHVGRTFGTLKLIAHLLDWVCLGVYLFRRLARNGDYPICSWLVAHAFSKAGKHFGVEPGAAAPDDIWDFIQEQHQIYERIHPLKRLW